MHWYYLFRKIFTALMKIHLIVKVILFRDKSMANDLIPNNDTQNYRFCRFELMVETFGH